MKKLNFLILIFSIFFFLFLSQPAFAVKSAYISEIYFSFDDPTFGAYSSGKGLIAKITDNNVSPGGKTYTVMPGVDTENYNALYNHNTSALTYTSGLIAKVNATIGTHTLYTKYIVMNIGQALDGAICLTAGDAWGPLDTSTKAGSASGWSKYDTITLRVGYNGNGYMDANSGPYTEKDSIILTKITFGYSWPDGYVWRDIGIGWSGLGATLDHIGRKVVLRVVGTNFSPPAIKCYANQGAANYNSPSPSSYCHGPGCPPPMEDVSISYGQNYTSVCSITNNSLSKVYVKMSANAETRLSWLTDVPYDPAMFCHPFSTTVYEVPAANASTGAPGTLNINNTFKLDETASPCSPNPPSGFTSNYRGVNLSHLCADASFYSCSDLVCTTKAAVSYSATSDFGRGPGKYLGMDMSETYSTTIQGSDGQPAYKVYFNLWNSDTKYNGVINEGDYNIDIQVLPKGDLWYKDHHNATFWKTLQLSELRQESGATPQFLGSFPADWTNYQKMDSYPFYFVIDDVQNFPPTANGYQLYVTTIWNYKSGQPGAQHTGVDEPIDQVVRSFAPGLILNLSDVTLGATENSASTTNTVENFSSRDLTIKIELSENIPNLKVSSPQNLVDVLVPAHTTFTFVLNFEYDISKPKPANDVSGPLTGIASFQIMGGSYRTSDTSNALIEVLKSADSPTANPLSVTPYYCQMSFPLVKTSWEFVDPTGHSQAAFQIQFDIDPSFLSPVIDTGKINSSSGSYYLQKVGEQLSWNTNYYWRIKVWCDNNGESNWIDAGSFRTEDNRFPTVYFDWSPEKPAKEQIIYFSDKSTCYDADGLCDSWFWDFGDGQYSTKENPTHTYLTTGLPAVSLQVSDSNGYSCSLFQNLEMGMPLPKWKEVPPY